MCSCFGQNGNRTSELIDAVCGTYERGSLLLDVRFRRLIIKTFQAHLEKSFHQQFSESYSTFNVYEINWLLTSIYGRSEFGTVEQSMTNIQISIELESPSSLLHVRDNIRWKLFSDIQFGASYGLQRLQFCLWTSAFTPWNTDDEMISISSLINSVNRNMSFLNISSQYIKQSSELQL